jgi:carbonic anhydrase
MFLVRAVFVAAAMLALPVCAQSPMPASEAEKERIRLVVKEVLREYAATLGDRQAAPAAKDLVRNLVQDNTAFMRANKPAHFQHFANAQHPRATVVSCSDSRVHMHAMDATPDGDLFVVRNIGNQISTAEGSIEYGVHHLHTPVLLIVGHSACGAIKAASGDYSRESAPIRRELDSIQIPRGESGMPSIRINVNNQVRYAIGKFEEDVLSGKLTVVGAIYDFRNDLGQGHGKLHVININGETDARRIAGMDLMQGHDAPAAKKKARASAGH